MKRFNREDGLAMVTAILVSMVVLALSLVVINLAVHNFCLVYLGVHILDALDLTAVAEAAAARKRWEFLLTLAPLAVGGGTGSPVNPIAVF